MSFWKETIKFGKLEVPRLMAAPLDGITDAPTRQLIREFSPTELLFTEMRHVGCVVHERKEESLRYKNEEHPIAFQFSANNLKFIEPAVEKVLERKFDMINLNIGCPARAVISSGSGSALMANLPKLEEIVTHFVKIINSRVPFTIKIRAGFKEKNAVEVGKLAESLGVDGIVIHPRTQPEGFTGRPDVELVAKLKAAVSIPIVFSGNVNSFDRAKKIYEQSGVDGFMIGRALWGCPWKIKEIADQCDGKTFAVSTKEAIAYSIKHLDLTVEHYGEKGFHTFKKQLPIYLKNFENAKEMRKNLLVMQSADEIKKELKKLL